MKPYDMLKAKEIKHLIPLRITVVPSVMSWAR